MALTNFKPNAPDQKYTNAAIVPINTNLFWIDMGRIEPDKVLSLHVQALGTSGTLNPEWSNDDVNWRSGVLETAEASPVVSTSSQTTTLFTLPVLGRYFRLRMSTATTAGTTNVLLTTVTRTGGRGLFLMGTSLTQGATAHDAAVSGNPVRMGSRAVTSNYTAVASGDAADTVCTVVGAQIVKSYSIPEADWQFASNAGGIVNTTDVVARAAQAAGIRNYVTGITAQNASATVATEFVIKDGATVLWRGFLGTSAVLNSAVGVTFATPLRGSAATALNVACVTTGAAVYANLQGYSAP